MNKKCFVSTGAFKENNLEEILKIADANCIHTIELAPGLSYDKNILDIIKNNTDFKFLIHNFFPTPIKPFALNLASNNSDIINKSFEMCKNNIDLAADINIPYYSVHCGFCFDSDGSHLGNCSQAKLNRINFTQAKENYINNLKKLCDYAESKGVGIAIENNVVAEYVSKEKDILLGVTGSDLMEIIERCDRKNLYILLDLAHAKVSDTYLKFGIEKMINMLKKYIVEVHVSENDGKNDTNMKLRREGSVYGWLKMLRDKIITLEAYNLEINEIIAQMKMIESLILGE